MPHLPHYRLYPLGDSALVVEFGNQIAPSVFARVQAFSRYLATHPFLGMVEQVPAFTTVTVYYDPLPWFKAGAASPCQAVAEAIEQLLQNILQDLALSTPRVKEIPVCYGGVYGPDLPFVAQTNGLTPEEVVALHTGGEYLVYMIGFAPGFPYLGGMSEKISAPRKATPRAAIPAGSLGIAGAQTGIYPLETPGGWQLIGRTPMALFRPQEDSPSLLKAGDTVRFYSITEEQFKHWKEEHES
ncbi:kinase inhibitor [Rufibacter radiotolerans]|uniref:Kinase inhibitor n=1 Tax=Rufibacter radiotolerans TaxID=1379910 RepID=A0A0H4VIF8_9BACT|nr:5-oxoprolinase subunit PxpB [Rufibacter radiotolerans]AKQ45168.1 kinase inhibitor [Rufibacter radiotolerans]